MRSRVWSALLGSVAACGTVTAVEPELDAGVGADAPAQVDATAIDASTVDASPDAPAPDAPLDTTAPDTILLAPGPAATRDQSRTIAFTSDDASASFRCALDGATPTPCSSPFTTAALADGAHTLAIAAVDPAGNVDPTPAEDRWRIDTAGPIVTFTGRPSDLTSQISATLAWSSDELATFQCSLDGAVTACGAGTSGARPLSNLTEGAHRFVVTATDALGNRGDAEVNWTVDRTPPTLRFAGTPPSLYATTITFTFAASEAATFTCVVRDDTSGAIVDRGRACGAGTTGTVTYEASLPGATLLRLTVDARDAAGNAATPIERLFCRGTAATCVTP